jgi:hypothetical protein
MNPSPRWFCHNLLPFFLSSGVRRWLASSDLSPLPFSYLIFFFARVGGAMTADITQGQRMKIYKLVATVLPFPSPTSSSFL